MPNNWHTNRARRQQLPPDWRSRVRPRIMRRDDHTCQLCKQRFRMQSLEIDHIGDAHDHSDNNLRVLCKPCHARRTSEQATQANQNRAARRYRQPEPHPGSN